MDNKDHWCFWCDELSGALDIWNFKRSFENGLGEDFVKRERHEFRRITRKASRGRDCMIEVGKTETKYLVTTLCNVYGNMYEAGKFIDKDEYRALLNYPELRAAHDQL